MMRTRLCQKVAGWRGRSNAPPMPKRMNPAIVFMGMVELSLVFLVILRNRREARDPLIAPAAKEVESKGPLRLGISSMVWVIPCICGFSMVF